MTRTAHTEDGIEALRARLSQAGAGGVVVKPLVYVKPHGSETLTKCETLLGDAVVWTHHEANGSWFWKLGSIASGTEANEADCKKMLWLTYEARIRSALYATPPAPAQTASVEAVAFPAYGEMPFSELGSAVKAAQFGSLQPYEFDPEFYPGHQIVGTINFNSLNRIVTWFVKRALASLTAPTQIGTAWNEEDPVLHPSPAGEDPRWQKLRDMLGLDGWHDGNFNGLPNPDQIVTHVQHVANERARLLLASSRAGGLREAVEQVRYHWEVIQGQCSEGDGFTERAATDLEFAIVALEAALSSPATGEVVDKVETRS